MPAWPASLPQRPLQPSYEEQPQNGVVESQMDGGPPKKRKRYTATFTRHTVEYLFDDADKSTFETFFANDIDGGALTFDWPHPEDGTTVTASFVMSGERPYRFRYVGGGHWVLAASIYEHP